MVWLGRRIGRPLRVACITLIEKVIAKPELIAFERASDWSLSGWGMIGIIKQETESSRHELSRIQQQIGQESQTLSRRGLGAILLFILISMGAFLLRDFDLFSSVSESVRQFLGYPPPSFMVSVALVTYCFSVLMIDLMQMDSEVEPQPKWSHLGYRAAFYFFYAVSGALTQHFLAVFFIGLLLYGVEQVCIMVYCRRLAYRKRRFWASAKHVSKLR